MAVALSDPTALAKAANLETGIGTRGLAECALSLGAGQASGILSLPRKSVCNPSGRAGLDTSDDALEGELVPVNGVGGMSGQWLWGSLPRITF